MLRKVEYDGKKFSWNEDGYKSLIIVRGCDATSSLENMIGLSVDVNGE